MTEKAFSKQVTFAGRTVLTHQLALDTRRQADPPRLIKPKEKTRLIFQYRALTMTSSI